MKFEMHIDSDNQAMIDDPTGETARLLREVAARIEQGETEGYCADSNGNKAGSWDFVPPGYDEDAE